MHVIGPSVYTLSFVFAVQDIFILNLCSIPLRADTYNLSLETTFLKLGTFRQFGER